LEKDFKRLRYDNVSKMLGDVVVVVTTTNLWSQSSTSQVCRNPSKTVNLTERIQGRGIPLSGSSGLLIPRPGITIITGTRTIKTIKTNRTTMNSVVLQEGAEFYESHLYCN
jgi:hypothetical protein